MKIPPDIDSRFDDSTQTTHVARTTDGAMARANARGRESDDELSPGAAAGEYVIRDKIGWGGCSTVYSAIHSKTWKDVAIKVMHPGLADSPRQVQRFVQEAQAVRLIEHPCMVEVHDISRLPDGRPYIVMELLRGVNLASMIQTRGRFTPGETLEVLEPVAEALTLAHEAGIIHRDIKASNIVIAAGPGHTRQIKLLDFGIAKLVDGLAGGSMQTTVGHVLGTPHSMAPEQIRGLPVDGRTDIYALGALLFRMLTGKHPFEGSDAITLTRMHIQAQPPAPSQLAPVPPAVDAVVRKAMEKDPARRYQTVRELIDALREALGTQCVMAGETRQALAIYVEGRVLADADLDDAVIDDLMGVLDTAEQVFQRHGFCVPLNTGNSVLGAILVPDCEVDALRRRAMDVAAELEREIALRPDADDRVRVNVCLHMGEAAVRMDADRPDRIDIVGGAIVDIGAWAPKDEIDGVCATAETLGFALEARDPSSRSYVRIGASLVSPTE